MKKNLIFIIGIVVLSCTIFVQTFLNNSLKLSLVCNKFEMPVIIYSGIDNGGSEYRIIMNDDTKELKIGHFKKNKAGVWRCVVVKDEINPETSMINYGWIGKLTWKRGTSKDENITEMESHSVYCGNNAQKGITIPFDEIPDGVAVNISQMEEKYMIHFVTYNEDGSVLNGLNIYEILKKRDIVQ